MIRRLIAIASLLTLATVSAANEAGAPANVEVLGWDAKANRVYVLQTPHEGDFFGDVCYYDLASPKPTALHRMDWNKPGEGSRKDVVLQRQLAALRQGLLPMPRVVAPRRPASATIVRRDTVKAEHWQVERTNVLVSFGDGPPFEVGTFGTTAVARPQVFGVPGRADRLFVLAFNGDPEDTDVRIELPVMVVQGETGVRKVHGGKAIWAD